MSKRLFIVAGLPASGKTSLIKRLCDPEDAVIMFDSCLKDATSTDRYPTFTYNGVTCAWGDIPIPYEKLIEGYELWWQRILKALFADKETIYVEPPLWFAKIIPALSSVATHYGYDVTVLVLDVPSEELFLRNLKRSDRVPDSVLVNAMHSDDYHWLLSKVGSGGFVLVGDCSPYREVHRKEGS